MIKSIRLKNFQGHSDTKVNLSDGVNVWVGQTDSGKTSLFRAMIWVVRNEPTGTSFFKDGESECEVEIVTDRGTVVRRRTSTENCYIVNGVKFTGLNSGVPEEVKEVLNLTEVNIGLQHDETFGHLDSGAKFSGLINKTTKLDIADELISALGRKIRELRDKGKEKEDDIAKLEAVLREPKFSHIPALETSVKLHDSVSGDRESVVNSISVLNERVEELKSVKLALAAIALLPIKELEAAVATHDAVSGQIVRVVNEQASVEECIVDGKQIISDRDAVYAKLVDADKLEKLTTKSDEQLEEYEKLCDEGAAVSDVVLPYKQFQEENEALLQIVNSDKFARLDRLTVEVEKTVDDKKDVDNAIDSLTSIRNSILVVMNNRSDLESSESKELEALETLEGSLTECPTCGQALDESHSKAALKCLVGT